MVGLYAEDTNKWGVPNCGARMSLSVKDAAIPGTSNLAPNFSVLVKNVSPDVIFIPGINLSPPIHFRITSPSGKDLSTHDPKMRSGSQISWSVKPGEVYEFLILIHTVGLLTETGTYQIAARWNGPRPDCQVTSQTLRLNVTPELIKAIEKGRTNGPKGF